MRRIFMLCCVAFVLSGCASFEEAYMAATGKFVGRVCKEPEEARKLVGKKLWQGFGSDNSQVCIPKAQRVTPARYR